MSLREAGKRRRREQILAAAEELIRNHGSVSFSMRGLAEKAGVAFVTPFNLFENKGGVLGALLEARFEAQRERMTPPSADRDPVERVFDLALLAGRAYTSDAALFRPLLRAVTDVEGFDHAGLYDHAVQLWLLALRDAVAAGMIDPERNVELLARFFHNVFRGALSLWLVGEIDTDEFEGQTEYGVALGLLGALTSDARQALLERGPRGRRREARRA